MSTHRPHRGVGEFLADSGKFDAEIDKEIRTRKFTMAELEEEEQSLKRLRRWNRELKAREVFGALGRRDGAAAHALRRQTGRLRRAGFPSLAPNAPQGWIVNADTQLFQMINDFACATPWLRPIVLVYANYGIVLLAALMLAGWWSVRQQANLARVTAAMWAPLAGFQAHERCDPLGTQHGDHLRRRR